MRFLLVLTCLLLLPLQALAQSDEVFEASREAVTTDEYQSVPKGMLLTPEQRQQAVEDAKKKAADAEKAAEMAATLANGIVAPTTEKTAEEKKEEIKTKEAAEETPELVTFETAVPLYRAGKFDEALKILQPLLDKKSHGAEELMGIMYRLGQGVPKDSAKAFELLSAAAESGRPLAAHHLGSMYFAGEGTAANPAQALMWLEAAILHYPDGPEKAQASQDRDNVFTQMTGEQQAEGKRLLREWLERIGEPHLIDIR